MKLFKSKFLYIFTILIIIILGVLYFSQGVKRHFNQEVEKRFNLNSVQKSEILTENDIAYLPPVVQKYLRFTGSTGKEKVRNFRMEFAGRIRSSKTDPWMEFETVQYNFIENPARFFYITAYKMGLPAYGVHIYKNETAIMDIKMLGLINISNAKGPEMNQGETVTLFNDMCCLAPASLISKNISWEILDSLSVRAHFTNGKITVSADLFFDQEGKLLNFISNDRFETKDGSSFQNYPWLTPIMEYREIGGRQIASKAQMIYRHPDGDFCYGEFILKNFKYNCKTIKK